MHNAITKQEIRNFIAKEATVLSPNATINPLKETRCSYSGKTRTFYVDSSMLITVSQRFINSGFNFSSTKKK